MYIYYDYRTLQSAIAQFKMTMMSNRLTRNDVREMWTILNGPGFEYPDSSGYLIWKFDRILDDAHTSRIRDHEWYTWNYKNVSVMYRRHNHKFIIKYQIDNGSWSSVRLLKDSTSVTRILQEKTLTIELVRDQYDVDVCCMCDSQDDIHNIWNFVDSWVKLDPCITDEDREELSRYETVIEWSHIPEVWASCAIRDELIEEKQFWTDPIYLYLDDDYHLRFSVRGNEPDTTLYLECGISCHRSLELFYEIIAKLGTMNLMK